MKPTDIRTTALAALFASSLAAQVRVPIAEVHDVAPAAGVRSVTVVVAARDSQAAGSSGADFYCDGTADQVTVARAVDAVRSTGGTVQLLEGTYRFTGELRILHDRVTIRGQGPGTVVYRPTGQGGSGEVIGIGSAQSRVTGVRIERIAFRRDGYTESGYTVFVSKAADVAIRDCSFSDMAEAVKFKDVDGGAIRSCTFHTVHRPIVSSGGSHIRICDNRGEKINTHFISVMAGERHDPFARDERDIVISGNFAVEGNSKGINCATPAGTSVRGVSITGNHVTGFGQGIQIGHGIDAVVHGNQVRDCKGVGLYVYEDGNRVTLSDNRVSGCSEGVMLGTARTAQVVGAVVRGNTIEDNNIGIVIGNAVGPVIAGNTIRDNNRAKTAAYGILAEAGAHRVVIEGNTFSGHTASGRSYGIVFVAVGGGVNPVVRNNVFWGGSGADERGVAIGGAATDMLVMSGNYFHGYRSVAMAVGTVATYGDYRGSRVFDGTSWTTIQ